MDGGARPGMRMLATAVLLQMLAGAVLGMALQGGIRTGRASSGEKGGKKYPYSALVCYHFDGLTRKFTEKICAEGELCMDAWDGEQHRHGCASLAQCAQLRLSQLPWVRCCDQDLCNA